jgi:Mn2+/Fe2+ NRAMP family transporter
MAMAAMPLQSQGRSPTSSSNIMSPSKGSRASASALVGSAFIMATSAIGPGFITQTTRFTEQLSTSFGFVILCSIVLDIVVQLNIWRVISVSGMRAQDLANRLAPGMGYVLAILIVLGGLAFNIGNVAGAAMGVQVIIGADLWIGVVLSVLISFFVFWNKEAGKGLDLFSKILGGLMIALIGYIAISSAPPVMKVMHHAVLPETIDTTAIIVLVGGTVGGYISFAGVHRLLDAGITGDENISSVSRAAVKGIMLASAMRILLFLAVLGIVVTGDRLDEGNPAATVFKLAAGDVGYRIFGVVLWCAAITSVVGSAYTSVSFLRTFHSFFEKYHRIIITFFITCSAVIFLIVGRPVSILIIAGALNAFILPLALGIILLASRGVAIVNQYRHPWWLTIAGWVVVVALGLMCIFSLTSDIGRLWNQ